MARAAFFSIPAHGHVNPTLPVVSELIRRGEFVTYYNTEAFRGKIESTGAEFRSYAIDANYDSARIAGNSVELICNLQEFSVDVLPQLLQDLKNDPVDYVIYDSLCPWGSYVAQILGIPAVCSHAIFALRSELFAEVRSPFRSWIARASLLRRLPMLLRIRRARRRLERTHGVNARNVLFNQGAQLNLVCTSREFHPWADLYDESYQFVGPTFSPPCEPEELVREPGDARLIYISMGTIFNKAERFYRLCFEALGDMPEKVVMSVGLQTDIRALGPLPSNFVVRQEVPQLCVLSKACLFLTHGGVNSVSEALFYGVPMLVFPKMIEQELNASQVRNLGAGLVLDERTVSAGELRTKVNLVLNSPQFAERAKQLGRSLRAAGGYSKAADIILSYRDTMLDERRP